ncbi:MAG: PTS sugar transporter subunit IIA [Myxococcales bacterium]|nr:PTS sugar transporter subunit IIA [Myxococcales bacterium]MCB9549509.1 PTS sugar transporter subunit IIA [Myxococcales bacterium]
MVHRVALDPRRVLLQISATDREALLTQMTQALFTAPGIAADLAVDEVVGLLMAREAERSFALGDGIALPHIRLKGVEGPRLCLATLQTPLAWGDEQVRLVALMIGPARRPGALLQVMGRVARLLASPESRQHIEQARDASALADWLQESVRESDAPILAEDIMRPSLGRIGPDQPLAGLVQRMAELNLDAAGITDEERRLVGQVSADDLFTHGVPDFFRQLKSVSFIAEFDPFEKYFDREHSLTVRDVMSTDVATVGPEATALEVVFLLSVKRYPKVYVVDQERRLMGVIDRIRVLDRIFNL